jgi:signal transduction histidine kinase
MPAESPDPSPEREQTDDSLSEERAKSDQEIRAGRDAVEARADETLRLARVTADEVLLEARQRADLVLEDSDPPLSANIAVARERVLEDGALERERAAADETLALERIETARVLARLLPVERDQTDQFLLTERVRSDDALAHRDDFLGLVSHDLRDLLSGIVLSSAVIKQAVSDVPEATRILAETARIERHAARMTRLISDLVDVASIDAGRLSMVMARGDLASLLAEAVSEFAPVAAVRHIHLALESVDPPLLANFDRARIFQVLANVIGNSIKFSPLQSRIVVRGERAGDSLKCSVLDAGPGIPSDQLEAVFERFSQVRKNDHRGLGLGLYISRCIVEAHDGRIWAESTAGEGTRVCFTLPA